MEGKFVSLVKEGDIAVVTINRPEALNALNFIVLDELESAFDEAEQDCEIRALIITGSGKAFIAGADIAAMSKMSPRDALKFVEKGHRVLDKLESLRPPTIAAVNGFALGGGTELAIACDLIYASEKARFGQPEVHLGIMPGFGGTQRLARLIGLGRAREMIYTGEHIIAEKAKEIGLALEVYPQEGFLEKVKERAKLIAAQGPVAVAMCKRVMNKGYNTDLATANELERQTFAALFATEDADEGKKAFLEKRNPDFKGK
ncbi:MAG: short-chain-enoyl-CoA hydratase [Myxococcota bacterium]